MEKYTILLAMFVHLFFCRESFGAVPNEIDLETMAQDYVLEAKQLHIPGHPTACNASKACGCLAKWKARYSR